MKLLGIYFNSHKATEMCGLLESRGIPTYGAFSSPSWRLNRFAIFICLDSQYKDAIALLSNIDHQVSNPVDVKEYHAYGEKIGYGTLLGWCFVALLLVILAFIAVALILGIRFSA